MTPRTAIERNRTRQIDFEVAAPVPNPFGVPVARRFGTVYTYSNLSLWEISGRRELFRYADSRYCPLPQEWEERLVLAAYFEPCREMWLQAYFNPVQDLRALTEDPRRSDPLKRYFFRFEKA